MAVKLSTTARSDRATALNTTIGANAILRIYSGNKPANPATAISGTLLAELTCGSTFGTVSNGVLTANAITQDSSANATGTASHFRLWKSDGTTAVLDGDVATNGSDLNLTTTSITSGQPVQVTSLVITEGNA
jgi:hypothetical protein